jgi:hypothetical protein
VGPRTGLDDVERRKILSLAGLEHDPSAVQPVDSRNTDCAFPALGGIKTSAKVGPPHELSLKWTDSKRLTVLPFCKDRSYRISKPTALHASHLASLLQ